MVYYKDIGIRKSENLSLLRLNLFSVSFPPVVYVPNQLIGVRLEDVVDLECRKVYTVQAICT